MAGGPFIENSFLSRLPILYVPPLLSFAGQNRLLARPEEGILTYIPAVLLLETKCLFDTSKFLLHKKTSKRKREKKQKNWRS